jgi:phenylpyruvate tautomerase PptA (4-oxalocrotonate tautomerase family)
MPIVHVHVARGRSSADRKAILDGIHAALVEAFRIPDHDRHQILHEHDLDHFDSAKGSAFTIIEMTVFPGRSADAKRQLYAAIVRNLDSAPGIPPDRVLVVLNEPPLSDWGIRGGKAATDVQIGFRLDV